MRITLVASLAESLPPALYGGIERIVSVLTGGSIDTDTRLAVRPVVIRARPPDSYSAGRKVTRSQHCLEE